MWVLLELPGLLQTRPDFFSQSRRVAVSSPLSSYTARSYSLCRYSRKNASIYFVKEELPFAETLDEVTIVALPVHDLCQCAEDGGCLGCWRWSRWQLGGGE